MIAACCLRVQAGSEVPQQLGQEHGLGAAANGRLSEPRAARMAAGGSQASPKFCQFNSQLLLSSKRNRGEATAESGDSGREGTPGTHSPEGKQQGLADAIHRRREDIFHLGFITEMSSWG